MVKMLCSRIILCLLLSPFVAQGDRMHGDLDHSRKAKRMEREASDEDKDFWNAVGQMELEYSINMVLNTNVAKNVILFLGDGMSIPTVTAARIYDGQSRGDNGEEGFLSFDSFPYVALSKTYCVDHQVPDSASTGTAFMTGVKTNRGVIGFDANVERGECQSITNSSFVDSIAKWSQDMGKKTGVVTSTRITHATPAASYAHVPERDWECDAEIPSDALEDCLFDVKDIARQLVEDEPGRNFNVIFGGGFQCFDGNATVPGDPDEGGCVRSDGRVLWQDWLDYKADENEVATFVQTRSELLATDLNVTTSILGLFANDHLPYEYEKRELGLDMPTLQEMTESAIQLLSQSPNGFFLLVEGGRIDHAHHGTNPRIALDETVAMHDAVQSAIDMTDEADTLIIVTADHSHTMTVNGYPERGNPITGIAGDGDDDIPYTTLSYANGPGYNYSVVDGEVIRGDPSTTNTSAWDYESIAPVPKGSETHGGDDVAIFASGPMAHLFHSVHEQNYIAHALAYASCVDEFQIHCQDKKYKGF